MRELVAEDMSSLARFIHGAQLWVDMQTKYDLWQAEQKLHDVLLNIQRLTDDHATV